MKFQKNNIPVRPLSFEENSGIIISKVSSRNFNESAETSKAHRHDSHLFGLQEKGISSIELDFEQVTMKQPSIMYQSPNQVHRVLEMEKVEMYLLVIEKEYIEKKLYDHLQRIVSPRPLLLQTSELEILNQSFLLCHNLYSRKEDQLYFSQLQNACNALIGLYISFYFKNQKPQELLSRFERIEKEFTRILEEQFKTGKRPSDYAHQMNISVSYLNECIKNVTGFSVSHHIQQRIILEAKRLLYHSDKSVKEIAAELGYEDYPYFSRLFTKIAGMSALTFKNKNHD